MFFLTRNMQVTFLKLAMFKVHVSKMIKRRRVASYKKNFHVNYIENITLILAKKMFYKHLSTIKMLFF